MQYILDSGVLKVGRVSVFAEDFLDENAHAGAGCIAVHPVYGDGVLYAHHQLVGDHTKLGLAHDGAGALVLSQRIVEGNFLV